MTIPASARIISTRTRSSRLLFSFALLAGWAAGGPRVARGEPLEDQHGNAGFALFSDSMETVIWSPHASAGATVGNLAELDVTWTADVISSASVDVITAATNSISETRHALTASARRESILEDLDLSGGYTFSFERDYTSHSAVVGLSKGIGQDNTELAINYGLTLNSAGVSGEPKDQWRASTVHTVETTWTQVVNPSTIFILVGSTYLNDGYQANPYRRVPIFMGGDLRTANWVAERVPDQRLRLGVAPRVRRALGANLVASGGYRVYADDWGVMSHTLMLDGVWKIARDLTLRLHQRATWQGDASFYQERYTDEREYLTRDRRLSAHISGDIGATMFWRPEVSALGAIDLYLGASGLAWRYNDFFKPVLDITFGADTEPLGWVNGVIFQAGAELEL